MARKGGSLRAFIAHSATGAKDRDMRRFSVLFAAALAVPAALFAPSQALAAELDTHVVAKAGEPEPHVAAPKKICLSAAETREEIKEAHLIEPFAALKFASQHFKSEALSAKLCRNEEEFVYEIALLHRDGKFFRAHVSALTGKLVEIKHPHEAPPKN
jgi:uncharacterized membrane protein YkoI